MPFTRLPSIVFRILDLIYNTPTQDLPPSTLSSDKPCLPDQLKNLQLACVREALTAGEYVTFHVNGTCMHPQLKHRETIRVHQSRLFLPGDLIAYRNTLYQESIVHRFLGYALTKSGWKYLIMADNASGADSLVPGSAILGKGVASDHAGGRRVHLVRRFQSVWRYFSHVLRKDPAC